MQLMLKYSGREGGVGWQGGGGREELLLKQI